MRILKKICIRNNVFATNFGNELQIDNIDIKKKIGRDIQIISLKDIPKTKNNQYNWKKSIGHEISFIYNDIFGSMKITGTKDRSLFVIYNGKEFCLPIDNILRPSLGVFLGEKKEPKLDFIYNVGDVIDTGNIQIKILDRERREKDNRKNYFTECLSCHTKVWRLEEQLDVSNHKYICPICASRECKPGFNDITITNPWMIPYFIGGEEEARQYTAKSGIKKYFKCPYCGKISEQEKRICELHDHGLSCKCNISWSYPERLVGAVLDQNDISYVHNYSPEWADGKKYDFYLTKYPIIIETDGELGHGFYQPWKTYEQSEKEFEIDELKNKMAFEHNLWMFRIVYLSDYKKEFVDTIKAELPQFIWKKTNWDVALMEAERNRKYAMCMEYDKSDKTTQSMNKICDKYHCHKTTLYKALRFGHELGWINYNPKTGKYHIKESEDK